MCDRFLVARRLAACAATALLAHGAAPSVAGTAGVAAQAAARVEPALTLEVEGFCSDTRLRTTNARLTWRVASGGAGAGVSDLAQVPQRLETTVFKGGFERGQFVALPIGPAAADRPVLAIAGAPATQAQAQTPPRRAFQIRLISVTAPRPATAATDSAERVAVVENLEPGVTYTWRIASDAPGGRVVSPPVTLRAPICPADMVEPPPPTPRRQP